MFNSPVLLRHGAPQQTGFCYGQSDPILEETPGQTAQRIRPILPPWRRVFCSPSARCADLAAAITAETATVPALMELNFGDWEGRRWDDIDRADLDDWAERPLDIVMPGGECGRDLYRRVAAWADTVQLGSDDLIIAHAGSLRALAARLLQRPFDDCWTWPLAYATPMRLAPNTAGFVSQETA